MSVQPNSESFSAKTSENSAIRALSLATSPGEAVLEGKLSSQHNCSSHFGVFSTALIGALQLPQAFSDIETLSRATTSVGLTVPSCIPASKCAVIPW